MRRRLYLETAAAGFGESERYFIRELPAVIGRQAGCDVRIVLERVSRRHARLEQRAERLVLSDLGSTNGTFVNHSQVTGPVPVIPGDIIHFADHEFRLGADAADIAGAGPAYTRGETTDQPTRMGFTAHPETFPLRAPEFYELINDGDVKCRIQLVIDGQGHGHGLLLGGHGTHPKLQVPEPELFELAEALGEEARLGEIIRAGCVAGQARYSLGQRLFLPVHAMELEDPEPLLADLAEFEETDPGARLVACITGLASSDDWPDTQRLRESSGGGLALRAGTGEPPPADRLVKAGFDYLFVKASRMPAAEVMADLSEAGIIIVATDVEGDRERENAFRTGAAYIVRKHGE